MQAEHSDVPQPGEGATHRLWEEQLADYRSILHLAQEETRALSAARFEILYHTQAQRERLARHILQRSRVLRLSPQMSYPIPQDVLTDITATIEATLALDRTNSQRLQAEHDAVADSLQQLREGKAALHGYKPRSAHRPQFLNRTV